MYVSGLKLGFTTSDLRTMPFNRLANMLIAWKEANAPSDSESKDTVVDATQAHIDAILG